MKRIQFSLLGLAFGAGMLLSCNMLQLLDDRIGDGTARPADEVNATGVEAIPDRLPREPRTTPTWTALPASGAIGSASATEPSVVPPRGATSSSGSTTQFNSPLATPPNSPLPTPLPPTSTPAPAMPTETATETREPLHTPTPTITGTRTETPTRTPSHQPITRTWTPTPGTPTRTRTPTATSPSSPLPTPTLPNSPLPTPTGTCCFDCDC